MCSLFVMVHKTRIAGHVCGQNRRQPALDPDWPLLHHGYNPTSMGLYDRSDGRPTGLMSRIVQAFGCRHDEAIHALRRPASEKRQGTKSREVGHRRCRGRLTRANSTDGGLQVLGLNGADHVGWRQAEAGQALVEEIAAWE